MEVHNIYNQVQVQLLMRPEELEEAPEFGDVFRDEEDEVGWVRREGTEGAAGGAEIP